MHEKDTQQITVTIAGRAYRMACGPGEEQHLTLLADMLDKRIEMLRSNVGEIGDMRLHVMAALTIADELSEARLRMDILENDLRDMHHAQISKGEKELEAEQNLIEKLTVVAEHIEKLALLLNAPLHKHDP